MLSEYMQLRFIETVRQDPLMENEIRQMEDMGETYIALTSSQVDEAVFMEMYSFLIDNVRYSVYFRL